MRCPACLGDRTSLFVPDPKDFEGYADTDKTFAVMRCADCRSIFLDPMPTLADTTNFYPPDYMSKADKGGLFRKMTDAWERRNAAAFVRRFGQDARVLDYGCGHGEFVNLLRDLGMDRVSGYDPMPKQDHCGFYSCLSELCGWQFDVIRMNNVIEHLIDFDATMVRLRGLLAPDGVVFGATANGAHWAASAFGRYWGFLHHPYHTLIFSPEGLKIAAARWGYSDVKIASMFEPSSWALTMEHYLKEWSGSTIRGHLPVYPFLVFASAPALAFDLVSPGYTTAIEFTLTAPSPVL